MKFLTKKQDCYLTCLGSYVILGANVRFSTILSVNSMNAACQTPRLTQHWHEFSIEWRGASRQQKSMTSQETARRKHTGLGRGVFQDKLNEYR